MATIGEKVDYVKRQTQTRKHHCHWPGCNAQVPPAKWGCVKHWYALPARLRAKIWRAYQPGQEVNGTPSKAYVEVAREVQDWIAANNTLNAGASSARAATAVADVAPAPFASQD